MSENAMYAYEDGEMPKSRWTKRAMLDAIEAVGEWIASDAVGLEHYIDCLNLKRAEES